MHSLSFNQINLLARYYFIVAIKQFLPLEMVPLLVRFGYS